MVSTAQRRLASRRHSPDPRPQQTLIQPSAAPQTLVLTSPASPRLLSVARSTLGLVVRPTKVRLQITTVLPEVPPIVQRAMQLPESLGLRPACAILTARWHPHLMIVLIVHSVSLFPSPTTGSERLQFLSPGLVLESPCFELASSVAAVQLQKLPGRPGKLAMAYTEI